MNIHLSWPANPASELVDTYEVWEQIDNGFWNVKSLVDTNHIVFETPSAGKYRWRVRAHNFIGYGPMWNICYDYENYFSRLGKLWGDGWNSL